MSQTVRWFGTPWPSPATPAPICEDETYRVDIPVGAPCAGCGNVLDDTARGVSIPHLGDAGARWAHFHAECFLANVLGRPMAADLARGWT